MAAAAVAAAGVVLLAGAALSEGGLADREERPRRVPFGQARLEPPETDPERLLRTDSANRWAWWEEAAGAAWDRPLSGHGAGSFALLHRRYRDDAVDVREAHSLPLALLAETGLVGAALALGGLALLGFAATRGVAARRDPDERAWAAALLAGTAAWALHGLVDWDWDIPALTLPALVFAGALAARPRGEPAASAVGASARSDAEPAAGPGASAARSPGPAAAHASRARPSTSPGRAAHALGLAAVTALLCAAAVSAALPAIARDLSDDAALTAGRQEQREAAERAERAARLDPLSARPLLAGAAIAERRRQYARAAELLREAAERQPDDPEVWLQVGRLQALFGDVRGTLDSALKGLELDPNDPTLAILASVSGVDHRRSASATGTPLPERP